MKRSRDTTLERDLVRAIQNHPTSLRSVGLASIVGAHIDFVRLALMDLSTEGITHRSKKGYYRLVPDCIPSEPHQTQ